MHSDYIMRMIERFVAALLGIVRSRKSGHYEEALTQIQNASQLYLNTDISSLLKYSPEQLLAYFRKDNDGLDQERCMICAELLHELAYVTESQQLTDAANRLKILSLYLYVNVILEEKQFQQETYFKKVATLADELKAIPLPDSVLKSLSAYQQKKTK